VISNILVTALDNAMDLWVEDKVVAVVLLVVISVLFWIVGEMKNRVWSILLSVVSVIAILLYLGLPKSLKIAEFSTTKSEYSANEEIYFRIKATQKAYYYLYTYNAEDTRILLYPKKSIYQNSLNANKTVRSGGFTVIKNPKYRDEKVMLIVSRYPLSGIKKEMSAKSFTKMLTDNENTTSIEREGEQVLKQRIISVKIKKPKFDITIDTKNIDYKLKEDIDIDVTSLTEGYGHIFEATPTKNITKITKEKFYNLEIRTGTTAKKPIGRHTVIAIFTENNRDIKPTDFIIEEEIVKGEPNYSIRFKNGKRYEYDIQWFRVEGHNTGHGL